MTVPANSNIRAAIDEALDRSDLAAARDLARAAWRQSPNASTARFLIGRATRLWPHGLVEHRVAILRSFTVEPVEPLLLAEAVLAGCRLSSWIGDYNPYGQEILDPSSGLYVHKPDTVVLALQTRDVALQLWSGFTEIVEEDVAAEINAVRQSLATLVASYASGPTRTS
ncbi:MAG: hypothetical protein KBC34_11330 [Phenylobacterium sp.]|nr:hypothetical protein [Phenylobacterium sp.]